MLLNLILAVRNSAQFLPLCAGVAHTLITSSSVDWQCTMMHNRPNMCAE